MSVAHLADAAPVLAPFLAPHDVLSLVSTSRELRALEALPVDLTSMRLRASDALRIAGLHAHRFTITRLVVDQCDQAALDALVALPGLASLTVKSGVAAAAWQLRALPATPLASLRLLADAGAHLADVSCAPRCTALHTLALHSAAAISDLAPLGATPRLRTLELRKLRLADLTPLGRGPLGGTTAAARNLTSLGLQGCRALSDVAPLALLRSLEELDLSSCGAVEDAGPLGELAQLRLLRATGCTGLRRVDGLARCGALRTLYLTGCTRLEHVSALSECAALHTLHLGRCRAVRDVSELGHCASLRVLNLRCSGAVVVPYRHDLVVEWDVGGEITYC